MGLRSIECFPTTSNIQRLVQGISGRTYVLMLTNITSNNYFLSHEIEMKIIVCAEQSLSVEKDLLQGTSAFI